MSYAFRRPQPLDASLPPETLFAQLQKSVVTFSELLAELHTTPDQLARTLADPATTTLLKTQTQIAALQLKLLALKYLPHAFAKLVNLMSAEKPEVARRATNTLIQLAGIPTHTKSAPPEPPTTPPDPPDTSKGPDYTDPHIQQVMVNFAFAHELADAGIILESIHYDTLPTLVTALKTTLDSLPKPPAPQ